MERFFLLRNNQESGPFTIRELKEKKLLTTDLLWLEGESTCWQHPAEITVLKGLPVQAPVSQPKPNGVIENASAAASAVHTASTTDRPRTAMAEDVVASPCFEELKNKYGQRKPRKKAWRKGLNLGANLLGLVTLVIGVMLAAFMVKKAIDNVEPGPMVATAEAEEISSETLPLSQTEHAAFSKQEQPNRVTALVPAPVQAETASEKPLQVGKRPEKAMPVGNSQQPELSAGAKGGELEEPASTGTASAILATSYKEEQKDEAAPKEQAGEKPATKPAVQLSANQYDVGFLGGISNLEVAVQNLSSLPVEKVVVEVDYLKPNGKPAGTKTVVVSGLAAGSTKKIAVPDHSRGVKVRYQVVAVE